MINTLVPLVVSYSPEIQGNSGYSLYCQPAPLINTTTMVNDGGQPWAADLANVFYDPILNTNNFDTTVIDQFYIIAYKSDPETTDIIGNISSNGFSWSPVLNQTDPPSHFLLVTKDFPQDCTFYPSLDIFSNNFCLAWLETQPTGRLDLKYSSVPLSNIGGPNANLPTPKSGNNNTSKISTQSTFYLYPRITVVESLEKTESLPLSDITVTDTSGATFTCSAVQDFHLGAEFSLSCPIYSFKWTQRFRMSTNRVVGVLTTLPNQINGFVSDPLPGITINIYYGHGNFIYKTIITDDKGYYSIDLQNFEYTFEVITQDLSINVGQRIL